MSATGSIPPNFHEGTRSEYLAQYLFSSLGTAVAVPHQEDHGLDLICTLTERIGQRAWAKAVYGASEKRTETVDFSKQEFGRMVSQTPAAIFPMCREQKDIDIARVSHCAEMLCMGAR